MFSATPNQPTLKIALYRCSSIGDVVLATACLRLLFRLRLPVKIYWLGRNPTLKLIEAAYPEVELVHIDLDQTKYTQEQIDRLSDVHLIIDLQKNFRSHLVCSSLSKALNVPVFTWNKEAFRRTSLIMRSRLLGRSHRLSSKLLKPRRRQYEMMLEAVRNGLEKQLPVELRDGIYEDAKPWLPTKHDTGELPWQKELRFGTWLAIAPGAKHETKRAPISIFQDTLARLLVKLENEKAGIGLVFLGDEGDRKLSTDLIDQLRWPYATLNLAGKLTLWETTLALAQTRILICNDSALAHIAEACQTPVAALFGPTIESFGFAPHLSESRAFSLSIGCRPCSKHGSTPCRYHDHACFTGLNTEEIANFLFKRLSGDEAQSP